MKPKLTTRQAAAAAGISLATLNVWIATGKFRPPKPVLVGALGMRLWSAADVGRIVATKKKIYRKGRGRKKGWNKPKEERRWMPTGTTEKSRR